MLCTREPPGGAAGCEAATVVWGACQLGVQGTWPSGRSPTLFVLSRERAAFPIPSRAVLSFNFISFGEGRSTWPRQAPNPHAKALARGCPLFLLAFIYCFMGCWQNEGEWPGMHSDSAESGMGCVRAVMGSRVWDLGPFYLTTGCGMHHELLDSQHPPTFYGPREPHRLGA